jgi:uncharacterized membrane protein YccC
MSRLACAAIACLLAIAGAWLTAPATPAVLHRELARKRKLVLQLSVVVQDPAGNRRTVRRQVTPRLKARRVA